MILRGASSLWIFGIKIYKTLTKWSRNMTDESSTQILNVLLTPSSNSNLPLKTPIFLFIKDIVLRICVPSIANANSNGITKNLRANYRKRNYCATSSIRKYTRQYPFEMWFGDSMWSCEHFMSPTVELIDNIVRQETDGSGGLESFLSLPNMGFFYTVEDWK